MSKKVGKTGKGGAKVGNSAGKMVKGMFGEGLSINKTSKAILKNGYYEVNGVKFSEYYYKKLWDTGRKAPSLVVKEVLEGGAKTAVPHTLRKGFNKYAYDGWEMIYNPTTK